MEIWKIALVAVLAACLGPAAFAANGTCSAGFLAPVASSYAAGSSDDGKTISPENATGAAAGWAAASLPISLPAMTDVTAGWTLCATSDNNKATVVGAPLLAAPGTPSLSTTSGGALGSRTRYVKTTYVNAVGETVASVEGSQAIGANNLLVVASPGASGNATGWNVYVGAASGNETKQNSSPISLASNWTEPTGGISAGDALPITGTAPSAYIVAGNSQLARLTLGPGNYEFAQFYADGANYRIIHATQSTNLSAGTQKGYPARWEFLPGPGYSATQGDNASWLSSALTTGGLTVTLPSTTAIASGWSLGLAADGLPVTINVNGSSGGTIRPQNNQSLSTFSVPINTMVVLSFDGASFRALRAGGGNISGITVTDYGAVCDGSTDDSTAITAAFADFDYIMLPPGARTCKVGDLVLSGSKILDCNGAKLTAKDGSLWTLKKTAGAVIRNCQFDDPTFQNMRTTTLAGAVAPGASTFAVTDASNFQNGMPINILLQSGAYWPTKIKPAGGISGNNITVTGRLPASATAAAVAAGGAGCTTGALLVAQGGRGAPAVLKVTGVTTGAATSVQVLVPGFYETPPSNPVTAVSHTLPTCKGVTVNLTTAGAASGAAVEGSWGTLIVDQSANGAVQNVEFGTVFAGLGVYSTSAVPIANTRHENFSNIRIGSVKFFGYWHGAGVNETDWNNIWAFGTAHGGSSYGVVGFMREYEQVANGSFPSGGNHFTNINSLLFENGTIASQSNRDFYTSIISDTNRNYSFICNGCNNNIFDTTIWSGQTGPSAISGTTGEGVGMYFGAYTGQDGVTIPASINNLSGYAAGGNAVDIYFADSFQDGDGGCGFSCGASIYFGQNLAGTSGSLTLSGRTWAIVRPVTLVSGQSGSSVGGAGTTVYIGQGIAWSATEANVISPIAGRHTVTEGFCAADTAPGSGQTYTCNLRVLSGAGLSGTTGGGGGGASIVTAASCTIADTNTYCAIPGPGIALLNPASLGWKIDSSAGAGPARFRGHIAGL